MTAILRDLIIEAGARLIEAFVHVDAAGDPVDVTDYTARMQVREDYDLDPVLDLTSAAGDIDVGTDDGTFTVEVSAVETAALTIETGYYDLEILPAGDEDDAIRLARGPVNVLPNVTRPAVP